MLEPGGRVVGQLEGQRLNPTTRADFRRWKNKSLSRHACFAKGFDSPGEPGVFSADARIRRV